MKTAMLSTRDFVAQNITLANLNEFCQKQADRNIFVHTSNFLIETVKYGYERLKRNIMWPFSFVK